MLLEESYVYSEEGLIEVLPSRPDRIIIGGHYANQILDIMKTHISSNSTWGMEVASAGLLTIFIYAIDSIRDLFSKEDKDTLYINKKLKGYRVESINNGQVVLKFKQLDH